MDYFTRLDDYILARITYFLPSPLDTSFRATCSRMRATIRAPLRMSASDLLSHGIHLQCADICKIARDRLRTNGESINLQGMFSAASHSDSRAMCELAHSWILEYSDALDTAALHDNRDLWILEYSDALNTAALHDNRDLCLLIREWILASGQIVDYNNMLKFAAIACSVDLCILAREWAQVAGQRVDYNAMLAGAAWASREMCELVRAWCAGEHLNYNIMLQSAAFMGKRDLCILAREWAQVAGQRVDYNAMLAEAVSGDSRKICKLAREWMDEYARTTFAKLRAKK
jgi:hypothetical protein